MLKNLKIGIIGLRPRQVDDVRRRQLAAELHFYTDKWMSAERVGSFCAGLDLVLLMTHHTPRSVVDYIPTDKRKLLSGNIGISALIREVETLVGPTPEVTPPVAEPAAKRKVRMIPAPKSVAPAEPVIDAVKLADTPAIQLAADIPSGWRSQYSTPKDDIHVYRPNAGGVHNYMILQAAMPGDVLRFARPAEASLSNWRGRIAAMRSMYLRKYQLLIEAHYYDEYVDLMVMRQDQKTAPVEVIKAAIEEAVLPPPIQEVTVKPSKLDTELSAWKDAGIITDTAVSVLPDTTVIVTPVETLPVLPEVPSEAQDADPETDGDADSSSYINASTEQERSFWRACFLREIEFECSPEAAAALADQAVMLHRSRFG